MDMPKVRQCDVADCAYNRQSQCHAMAITVGDEDHPRCDTYLPMSTKGGEPGNVAGVGACKVPSCRFNRSLECHAPSIQVGYRQDEVDCLTFSKK